MDWLTLLAIGFVGYLAVALVIGTLVGKRLRLSSPVQLRKTRKRERAPVAARTIGDSFSSSNGREDDEVPVAAHAPEE